ncbi:hypothetical protein MMC22_011862 [Lobaria immixta]|nr:hypothetical protein [Lobaria immixta]
MADTSTSILPDRADSDASTPTLMSLPFEMIELILTFLLPDKDVLRVIPTRWEGISRGVKADDKDDAGFAAGDVSFWDYDDRFRYDREPVQTAILRVNNYLYEVGSQILYGRTIEVNITIKHWIGKMRKILISVHAVVFEEELEQIRNQLLLFYGFLVSNDLVLRKLHVICRGEWDPHKITVPHDYFLFGIDPDDLRPPDNAWTKSAIQLPASVRDDARLAGEVERCIRGMKGEAVFADSELHEDWKSYLLMRKALVQAEERVRQMQEKWLLKMAAPER